MPRRLAALVPVAAIISLFAQAYLVPAVALAGSTTNPLSPSLPVISTPTATTPAATLPVTTTASSGGGSFTGADAVAVALATFALLGGISFFIWHDARRRAPHRGRAVPATVGAGSKPKPKTRKPSPAERRRRKRGRAR